MVSSEIYELLFGKLDLVQLSLPGTQTALFEGRQQVGSFADDAIQCTVGLITRIRFGYDLQSLLKS